MKNNPFVSDTFVSRWLAHFQDGKQPSDFGFIEGLSFYRPTFLPLYINVGKNLTKGISYLLKDSKGFDHKKKIFLIYDVPTYFNINTDPVNKKIKLKKSKQYPGFLIELGPYRDLDHFLTSSFSKSSRYKFNKYKKKLEASFDIRYKMFYGDISKEEYDSVFGHFNSLLKKRFLDKQITNNNLDPAEWNFYYDVALPLIQVKKASLFVIYDGTDPIGVTLNYFSEDIFFDAITVFDIDYSKFRLGSVTIMKLIEWCLENNIKTLDFSKGYFDYKEHWGNKSYGFEYHVYYDSSSLICTCLASAITAYFNLKQALRNIHINEKLHRLTFLLKNKTSKKEMLKYAFLEMEQGYIKKELVEIDFHGTEYSFLKTAIFDFLYLNNESYKDMKVYRFMSENGHYLFEGATKKAKAIVG